MRELLIGFGERGKLGRNGKGKLTYPQLVRATNLWNIVPVIVPVNRIEFRLQRPQHAS